MEANLDELKNLPKDSFEPLTAENHEDSEKIAAPSLNFFQDAWRRLKKNKGAVISMWILIFIIAVVTLAIWFTPHNPATQNLDHSNLPPKISGLEKVNGFNGTAVVAGERVDKYKEAGLSNKVKYVLGTDVFGRDIFSRILSGTRVSLTIAFLATLLDLTIGVAYGLISGWKGGRTDNIMQRIIEILSGVPTLVVVVLMMLIFKPGMTSIVLAMAITGWITMARIVRAQTLKLKDQEYVLAARTLGESSLQIAAKHLLPNVSGVIIIQTMFTIPTAIFFEAFLSFIGIGLRPPNASLGILLNEGYKTLRYLPYQLIYPAVVLCVIMICFNLLADGIRDAFDPKMKD